MKTVNLRKLKLILKGKYLVGFVLLILLVVISILFLFNKNSIENIKNDSVETTIITTQSESNVSIESSVVSDKKVIELNTDLEKIWRDLILIESEIEKGVGVRPEKVIDGFTYKLFKHQTDQKLIRIKNNDIKLIDIRKNTIEDFEYKQLDNLSKINKEDLLKQLENTENFSYVTHTYRSGLKYGVSSIIDSFNDRIYSGNESFLGTVNSINTYEFDNKLLVTIIRDKEFYVLYNDENSLRVTDLTLEDFKVILKRFRK